MDASEYMGVLTSPFTTEREKERVLKKIRKRYAQEKRQEKEIELFGRFINYKKFPVAEKMVREGRNYGVEARIKDRFSILMHNEGRDVSLFVDEEFITKGTYRDVKREFKRLKENFEKTVKEMEEMHTEKKERPQIELPSWTKHLWGVRYNSYEVSKDGLKVGVAFSSGISIMSDKSEIKMSIMPGYHRDGAIENIFNAIAKNEGLIYMRNGFQPPYAKEYGYYIFEKGSSKETLPLWYWQYKYLGHGSKKEIMKNIEGKVYRANKLSDNGFYKISHETQKSIWLEPVNTVNINKYLEDFERNDQYILSRAFRQPEKYQDSEKEAKQPNDLEKELDNLERTCVSEEKTKTGAKAKI